MKNIVHILIIFSISFIVLLDGVTCSAMECPADEKAFKKVIKINQILEELTAHQINEKQILYPRVRQVPVAKDKETEQKVVVPWTAILLKLAQAFKQQELVEDELDSKPNSTWRHSYP